MLLLTTVTPPRYAAAAPPLAQVAVAATRRVVRLDVLGSPEETAQLRRAVSEQFGRIGVELAPMPGDSDAGPASPEGAKVIAEVDLRDAAVAKVRLSLRGGP